MKTELGLVKKYKPITNLLIGLILCVIFAVLIFSLYFIISTWGLGENDTFWIDWHFWSDLIFAGAGFVFMLIELIYHIQIQIKFNKSAPANYINYISADLIKIKDKCLSYNDILEVKFVKTSIKDQIANCEFIMNRNLGNITIKFKSSKIILERVADVENSANEIKKFIKKKGNVLDE